MLIKIITPVSIEPITLSELKQHLRFPEGSDEDELLLQLIMAAREYGEHYTRRALAEQTLELIQDRFPSVSYIDLPYPPLRSVAWIKYRDSDGVDHTLPTDSYSVDNDREPGRVVLQNGAAWPVFTPFPSSSVRIQFAAGYDTLPNTIRQALLMLIGHWYENREATGNVSGEIAFSVHALLAPYRVEAF